MAGRVLPFLVTAVLVAAIPGCSDTAKKSEAPASGGVAPNVQESNKNMENFMKSQGAKK
jgi:hypothetical protein